MSREFNLLTECVVPDFILQYEDTTVAMGDLRFDWDSKSIVFTGYTEEQSFRLRFQHSTKKYFKQFTVYLKECCNGITVPSNQGPYHLEDQPDLEFQLPLITNQFCNFDNAYYFYTVT